MADLARDSDKVKLIQQKLIVAEFLSQIPRRDNFLFHGGALFRGDNAASTNADDKRSLSGFAPPPSTRYVGSTWYSCL